MRNMYRGVPNFSLRSKNSDLRRMFRVSIHLQGVMTVFCHTTAISSKKMSLRTSTMTSRGRI